MKRDETMGAGLVLANLRRIIHAIHAQSSSIEAAVGITGPQLWALREIDGNVAGLALSELADRLALHRANAGRLVERLLRKKLVECERPASDRRFVLVRITTRGRSLARRRVADPAQAGLLAKLEHLPAKELDAIHVSLRRLVELLGAERVDATPIFEDDGRAPRRTRRR